MVGEREGDQMEFGQVLAPLAEHRRKMLFIRGLFMPRRSRETFTARRPAICSRAPLASGGEIRSGTSIDQLLAQRYGASTKVPSLVLGCEKSNPSVHKNYSMLYSSHIRGARRHADTAGDLSGAGVRPALQGRGAAR